MKMTKWTRANVMAPCGLNDPAAPRHIAKVTRNPNPRNPSLTSTLDPHPHPDLAPAPKPELTLTTSPSN